MHHLASTLCVEICCVLSHFTSPSAITGNSSSNALHELLNAQLLPARKRFFKAADTQAALLAMQVQQGFACKAYMCGCIT
jgi:hypothetical protein